MWIATGILQVGPTEPTVSENGGSTPNLCNAKLLLSGKSLHNYGKIHHAMKMAKSTISMVMSEGVCWNIYVPYILHMK